MGKVGKINTEGKIPTPKASGITVGERSAERIKGSKFGKTFRKTQDADVKHDKKMHFGAGGGTLKGGNKKGHKKKKTTTYRAFLGKQQGY